MNKVRTMLTLEQHTLDWLRQQASNNHSIGVEVDRAVQRICGHDPTSRLERKLDHITELLAGGQSVGRERP